MTDADQSRRRIRRALLAVLGLGLLVRLLHFWALAGVAFPRIPLIFTDSDPHAYWEWAQKILAGDWLGRDTYHPYFETMRQLAPLETWYRWWGGKEIFHQAPLYPYLVAGLLALSGGSLIFVLFAQLLVGSLQPLVLFGLGQRLFDARVGLASAALTALYGPFIFYEGLLRRDWLPPLLEPLALLALVRAGESRRERDWLVAGAALGLALLAKETIFLFLPFVGLWLLWEHRPAWRRAIPAGASLLVGLLLCLSPLFVRNALVGAPIFSLSNRAAQSFISGNAADSSPRAGRAGSLATKSILERTGGKLPAVIRETLQTYQGDYGAFLYKQVLKLRGLVDPSELSGAESYYYGQEISPILRLTLNYGLIFPLGLAGLLLACRQWRGPRLLPLYILATVGGLLFSSIGGRYRLPLVPVLILYGGTFLTWLFETIRHREVFRMLGGLGLLLGVTLAQQFWLPLAKPEEVLRLEDYHFSAQLYASEGQPERAVREIERLASKARQGPGFPKIASAASLLEGDYRALWARKLLAEGKREEAKRQAIQAEAAYAAHANLSYPAYNLGQLYLTLNEPGKAKAFFDQFLILEPEGPRADRVRRLRERLGRFNPEFSREDR